MKNEVLHALCERYPFPMSGTNWKPPKMRWVAPNVAV